MTKPQPKQTRRCLTIELAKANGEPWINIPLKKLDDLKTDRSKSKNS